MDRTPEEEPDDGGRRRSIVAIVAIVAVVLATLFIAARLKQADTVQDCVASGRTNCAPVAGRP